MAVFTTGAFQADATKPAEKREAKPMSHDEQVLKDLKRAVSGAQYSEAATAVAKAREILAAPPATPEPRAAAPVVERSEKGGKNRLSKGGQDRGE